MIKKSNLFKTSVLICLTFISIDQIKAQDPEQMKAEITKVMREQEKAWSEGDMEAYMQGYWQSDSLRFLSNNRLTFGWDQQLKNYKISYPDKSVMGILKFEILSIESLGTNSAFVIGTYQLKRKERADAFGYYSLIWKKKDKKWVIVFDHSN